MAADVEVPYSVLNELNGSLKQIIVEFEDATARSEHVEGAIGSPLGRDGLRDQARRFEEAWDDKRETLKQDLEKVQAQVEAVGQGWNNWDVDAAGKLSVDSGETANLPLA